MRVFQRNLGLWPYVAGHFSFAAAMLLAGLLLLQGGYAPMTVTIIVAAMWAGLAVSVVASIARFRKAIDRATKEDKNPLVFLRPFPLITVSASLLTLAVAVGVLFAAGQPVLAATLEVYLLLRTLVMIMADSESRSKRGNDVEKADSTSIVGGPELLAILMVSSAVWLALGESPFWAESMIVTALWLYAMVMVVGAISQSVALQMRGHKHILQSGQRREEEQDFRPSASVTPESARRWGGLFVKWLLRAAVLIVAWGLWTAGHALLASLCILGSLFLHSAGVQEERLKQGDTARSDLFARAMHAIFHWPLVIAGATVFFAIALLLSALSAIYDRITVAPRPQPAPDSERDERVRQARIRRAAASYRLRAAFDRPAGFIYFMSSEQHQRDHFLGPGGLLADFGDRVVARDYRKHVLETRTSYNWRAFEQAPEGALLHVNGISNMRRDLPFIAVVPPYGAVRVFRLSEPYRARKRDGGVALAEAETEVRAAIAEAFEPASS